MQQRGMKRNCRMSGSSTGRCQAQGLATRVADRPWSLQNKAKEKPKLLFPKTQLWKYTQYSPLPTIVISPNHLDLAPEVPLWLALGFARLAPLRVDVAPLVAFGQQVECEPTEGLRSKGREKLRASFLGIHPPRPLGGHP